MALCMNKLHYTLICCISLPLLRCRKAKILHALSFSVERGRNHRPNPFQEAPKASWIRWNLEVRPCLPLRLVVCVPDTGRPGVRLSLQRHCSGDRWPSPGFRCGDGVLEKAARNRVACAHAAAPPLRTETFVWYSEVASDWYKLMMPQRTMRPSTVGGSEHLDPRFATSRHTTGRPMSHTTFAHAPIACRYTLPIRLRDRRLRWHQHTCRVHQIEAGGFWARRTNIDI